MSVVAGVNRDLAQFPEALRESGLAAVALAMADRIDEGRGSPSECGKVVIEALTRLRELAPPKREKDAIDELESKRERRRAKPARRAAAKTPSRS